MTVGEIIRRYQKDGYPDHYRQQREGRTMESESRNCIVLLKFLDRYFVSEISLPLFDVTTDGGKNTSNAARVTARWIWI